MIYHKIGLSEIKSLLGRFNIDYFDSDKIIELDDQDSHLFSREGWEPLAMLFQKHRQNPFFALIPRKKGSEALAGAAEQPGPEALVKKVHF